MTLWPINSITQAYYTIKKTEYLLFEKGIVYSAITSTGNLAGELTTTSKEMLTSQNTNERNNLKGIHLTLGNGKKLKGKRGEVKEKVEEWSKRLNGAKAFIDFRSVSAAKP